MDWATKISILGPAWQLYSMVSLKFIIHKLLQCGLIIESLVCVLIWGIWAMDFYRVNVPVIISKYNLHWSMSWVTSESNIAGWSLCLLLSLSLSMSVNISVTLQILILSTHRDEKEESIEPLVVGQSGSIWCMENKKSSFTSVAMS